MRSFPQSYHGLGPMPFHGHMYSHNQPEGGYEHHHRHRHHYPGPTPYLAEPAGIHEFVSSFSTPPHGPPPPPHGPRHKHHHARCNPYPSSPPFLSQHPAHRPSHHSFDKPGHHFCNNARADRSHGLDGPHMHDGRRHGPGGPFCVHGMHMPPPPPHHHGPPPHHHAPPPHHHAPPRFTRPHDIFLTTGAKPSKIILDAGFDKGPDYVRINTPSGQIWGFSGSKGASNSFDAEGPLSRSHMNHLWRIDRHSPRHGRPGPGPPVLGPGPGGPHPRRHRRPCLLLPSDQEQLVISDSSEDEDDKDYILPDADDGQSTISLSSSSGSSASSSSSSFSSSEPSQEPEDVQQVKGGSHHGHVKCRKDGMHSRLSRSHHDEHHRHPHHFRGHGRRHDQKRSTFEVVDDVEDDDHMGEHIISDSVHVVTLTSHTFAPADAASTGSAYPPRSDPTAEPSGVQEEQITEPDKATPADEDEGKGRQHAKSKGKGKEAKSGRHTRRHGHGHTHGRRRHGTMDRRYEEEAE